MPLITWYFDIGLHVVWQTVQAELFSVSRPTVYRTLTRQKTAIQQCQDAARKRCQSNLNVPTS